MLATRKRLRGERFASISSSASALVVVGLAPLAAFLAKATRAADRSEGEVRGMARHPFDSDGRAHEKVCHSRAASLEHASVSVRLLIDFIESKLSPDKV